MPDLQPTSPNPAHLPPMPAAVRRQIEETDALIASMNATPPGSLDPAAEPAATPEGAAQQPPAADGHAPATPQPPEDEQTWEQRYKSQQGRFEQMLRANQAMNEQVGELQRTIAAMQVRGVQPAPDPNAAQPTARQRLVTPEEESEYGPEFMTVVGKKARDELIPEVERLANELKEMKTRIDGVGTVVETTQKSEMQRALAAAVPDWYAINHAPEFHAWLAQPDPYSGRKRHDMLREAHSRQESQRVITFFKGFLAEATGLPQNPQGNGSSAPPLAQPGNGSGKPSLADFAAPGRARSAPQPLPSEKPVYTQADIAKFADERRRGMWRGREAEAEAKDRDIFQAQHEGRILM